jgi:hypothetical protein
MKTTQLIETLGWETEHQYSHGLDKPIYRAYQGGFKTLWRTTPEQVLKDVQSIVEARKSPANVPF